MTRLHSLHPEPNIVPGKYRHYKGKFYEVLGVARHSETLEEMVVYKALYANRLGALWVRPKKMFTEMVEVEGKKMLRFEYVKAH